ncbi:MAG: HAD-IIA family hydrolase [Actinomycetota bacterium]
MPAEQTTAAAGEPGSDIRSGAESTLLERYSAFALDLDGVVWRGATILPGAVQALNKIRNAGKKLLLLSNNASYSPRWVIERLGKEGAEIGEDEILTSMLVARRWITERGLGGKRAFLLVPADVIGHLSDVVDPVPVERGQDVELVLVGRDTAFSFERLAAAADAIRAGATFVSVNRDPTLPAEGGRLDPGTGSVLSAIETASGLPATVLGKPEQPMMKMGAEVLGVEGVLMVGDRLSSDIAGARNIGWDAALVLSGVTDLSQPLEPPPDYVLDSVAELAVVRPESAAYEPGTTLERGEPYQGSGSRRYG